MPDIVVQPNLGVIYTSSTSKDEEHGGNAPDDSHPTSVSWFPFPALVELAKPSTNRC
jgi:hypothetical protein